MELSTPEVQVKRWPYLVYGFFMMLFLGLIYAWSVFITPLETTFGWVRSQTSLIFTISMSSFCLGGILAGFLIKRAGFRKTMFLSGLFILSGFIGSTRIQSLMGIYLTYGVLCGMGAGLGYNATLEARKRLTAGLILLRDSENRYYLTPNTKYSPEFARKEVIRRIFRQFGIFSAEMLGFYIKGEYRMFELRTILQELEDEGFLVKGYFLRNGDLPGWQSDSLHWIVKEDVKQVQKRPVRFDVVLTARDNLAYYLVPMVGAKFGMGSSWIVISDGEMIGAASVQLKKTENRVMRFEGSRGAWDMLRSRSMELGKRLVLAKDKPEPSEADDVEDWYEKFVRPGG